MDNSLHIGLGVEYPLLSEGSIVRLKAFAPDADALTLSPVLTLPEPESDFTEVLDAAGVPLYSGTLCTLYYTGYLAPEEQARFLPMFAPSLRSKLDGEVDIGFLLYWAFARYPRYRTLKYRFVWAFRLPGTAPFSCLSCQCFAASDWEPWMHVLLNMNAHSAHLITGDLSFQG